MEAATPLRPPRVAVFGDVVVADALAVRDRCAVELVRERSEAGADPPRCSSTRSRSAPACCRASRPRSTPTSCAPSSRRSRARSRARSPRRRARSPSSSASASTTSSRRENGHLAKELERLFGAESAVAVQHQLRDGDGRAVRADARGPAQAVLLRRRPQPAGRLQGGHDGRDAARGRAAGHEPQGAQRADRGAQAARSSSSSSSARSTPRSRPSTPARPPRAARTRRRSSRRSTRSPRRAATTATRSATCRGTGGRKGDVLVGVDGAAGPPRARIVFEAKNAYVPKNKAVAELDAAMEQRDADYGVWVVPSEDLLPGHGAAAARGQRRQAVRRLRPRRRRAAWGSRWRTRSPAPARSWRPRTARGSTAARCAPRSSARSRRWTTSAGSSRSSRPRRRDRLRAPDPRRDGRARARPPGAGRRARGRRDRRRLAAPGPPRLTG